MTVEMFLILLTILSTLTSLCTEGVKALLDSWQVKYASNIVVLAVAVIVGGFGTVIFYLLSGYAWTVTDIVCIPLMMLTNWLGAMLGYDKVKQAITQIKGGENNG